MNLITLTTDFGTSDWFVGTLHGVILSLAPRTRIVDITHAIPAGDIRAGAFALRCAAPWFPKGTVHLAVVDPGVGGSRHAIAVRTPHAWFVGPDNGLLSWALAGRKIQSVRRLENTDLFLPDVSRTFHGRDIFAPVAARLASGRADGAGLGPRVREFIRLPWPEPRCHLGTVQGEILYLDRFGNAITNLTADHLPHFTTVVVNGAKGRSKCPVKPCYSAVPPQQAVAVLGSSGWVEIALNQGSAAEALGLKVGDPVTLSTDSPTRRARSLPVKRRSATRPAP